MENESEASPMTGNRPARSPASTRATHPTRGEPATTGVSRRSVLIGALGGAGVVLGAGSLTSCVSPAAVAGGSELVRFWNLFSGGDGILMVDLINEVRQDLPDLTVQPVTLAWGAPYYTKLAMASAGGRGPEVAIMHMSRLAGYAPGGLLDPWDLDLLAELDVSEEDFNPSVWERAQYNGEVYAIPLDTHPFIVFYNTDIAEQAGLLGPDGQMVPLDSPEAFLEAGRAMQEITGEYGVAFGYLGGGEAWRFFWSLYPQTGAEIDLSGDEVQMDREAAVMVVEFMKQVLDGTIANPADDYPAAIASFVSGRSGMILSGEWELPTYRDAGIPFDAMPFPTIYDEPAGLGDSHSFVLPHQNNVDASRRGASHQFVAAMLKNSLLWAKAGHIPAYQPVTETSEYAELVPQSHYVEAGEYIAFDPPAWFTGSGSTFQEQMAQSLQTTLFGGASAEEAVDQMIDQMNTFLATPNPA